MLYEVITEQVPVVAVPPVGLAVALLVALALLPCRLVVLLVPVVPAHAVPHDLLEEPEHVGGGQERPRDGEPSQDLRNNFV